MTLAQNDLRLVRRTLLRSRTHGNEVKTKVFCLRTQFCFFPIFGVLLLLILEDAYVILLVECDHVVDDARELMGGSGHSLRSSHSGSHPPKIVSQGMSGFCVDPRRAIRNA
jgi:hypothetical protein